MIQLEIDFRGATYNARYDKKRLGAQCQRVLNLMLDGEWRSLKEIETATGDPQASISARLRDLRHDGYTVDTRRRGNPYRGCWEYRVLIEG